MSISQGCQQPPDTGRGRSGPPPGAVGGSTALPTPRLQPSDTVLSHPVCGDLWQQPWEMNRVGSAKPRLSYLGLSNCWGKPEVLPPDAGHLAAQVRTRLSSLPCG